MNIPVPRARGVKEAKKMCTCIKDAEQCIKDEIGADEVQFEHFGHQSSEVRITPFRKDGQRSKNRRYTRVNWRFCPLCGEDISDS